MKKLLSKIPAMIAMLISLLSFYFYVQSFFDLESEVWIGSVIVAVLSMPFYFIDAVISLVKAVKKDDSKFNFLLALVLIGAIPLLLQIGGSGNIIFNLTWNVYYLLMFVLEAVSIKKAWAAMKARKAAAEA